MAVTTLAELAAMILTELSRREDLIASRRPRGRVDDDPDVRYGPRYSPTWFGPDYTEARRKRLLRTIDRLGRAGLLRVAVTPEAGRLERLKLTEKGRAAAAGLKAAEQGA